MNNEPIKFDRSLIEREVTERFLETPCERSFADLFRIFTPQLVSFFRARGCELTLAEDLGQEVMLTIHRKATQIRDRALFRAWMFKVARHALAGITASRTGESKPWIWPMLLNNVAAARPPPSTPTFEFGQWMDLLDSQEREALALRFIEEWEYHEISLLPRLFQLEQCNGEFSTRRKSWKPHLRGAWSNRESARGLIRVNGLSQRILSAANGRE